MKEKSRRISFSNEVLHDWLVRIQPELPVRCIDIRRRKDGVFFHFEGFPPQIVGQLNDHGFTFWGEHFERFEDMISDVDVWGKKSKKGYFCALCKQPKYYQKKSDLLDDHLLNDFKDFLTKQLIPAQYLVYMASYRDGKRAGISACELVKDRDGLMRELGLTEYLANNLKAVPKEGEDWKLPPPSDTLIDLLVPLKGDVTKTTSQTGRPVRR